MKTFLELFVGVVFILLVFVTTLIIVTHFVDEGVEASWQKDD